MRLLSWSPLLLAAVCAAEPGLPPVDLVAGTQTIGAKYHFGRDALTDSARAILAMGSDTLKISLAKQPADSYMGLPAIEEARSLVEVLDRCPAYSEVLALPFRSVLLWVYPVHGGGWQDGFSEEEAEREYREVRDLAERLLTDYRGSGKSFYLGHWEGDWHLHPGYNAEIDPTPTALEGMVAWLRTRQRAIDDAKAAVPPDGVSLWHYTEANLVRKGMAGRSCLVNDVLPRADVDFVSYSSYDSLGGSDEGLGQRLRGALDWIEGKLPPKPGIPGKRVFIGEYGFPSESYGPERQAKLSKQVIETALEWGCPFALYWEMYNNEQPEGRHRGFWLIDDRGFPQPVYELHASLLWRARAWITDFRAREGRDPTQEEYRAAALGWLRER